MIFQKATGSSKTKWGSYFRLFLLNNTTLSLNVPKLLGSFFTVTDAYGYGDAGFLNSTTLYEFLCDALYSDSTDSLYILKL